MKTRIPFLIVLVAVLGGFLGGPLSAASMAYSVRAVIRDGAIIIKVGSADSTVSRWLGEPDRKLGDDVWAFYHFVGSREEVQEQGCSTLLLTVANGKVADIKLVNDRSLAVVAAQTQVDPAAGQHIFVASE
jgi:hypothetical protein